MVEAISATQKDLQEIHKEIHITEIGSFWNFLEPKSV